MARVDPKAYDPDRYDAVKKDQEEIRRKCDHGTHMPILWFPN